MAATHRDWAWTLPNPESNEITFPSSVRYAIWQREKSESGLVHLQGCIMFVRGQRFAAVLKILPGAHIEPRKGTRDQMVDYCKKQDETYVEGPWEHGAYTSQGTRSDLESAVACCKEKRSIDALYDEHTVVMIRYERGFRSLLNHLSTLYEGPRIVHWYWGSTGTGKTRKVAEETTSGETFWKSPGTKWFDGYEGEKTVVLDDFRGSWWTFSFMLRLLDRYPLRVEVKGGHRAWNAETIYVTCCKPPNEVYELADDSIDQLVRRVTHVTHFNTTL